MNDNIPITMAQFEAAIKKVLTYKPKKKVTKKSNTKKKRATSS